jgi:hypothetical protein
MSSNHLLGHGAQITGAPHTIEYCDAAMLCDIFSEQLPGYDAAYHFYKTCQDLTMTDQLDFGVKEWRTASSQERTV